MTEVIKNKVCDITENNIHIKDSYDVNKKSEMSEILYIIKRNHPECKVFEVRKWDNLLSEWKAHNRLFFIGYKRSQTGSVDLDTDEPLWHKILYAIIGI